MAGKIKVCSKIWFEVDGSRVFGSGLAQLLSNVDRLGTLQEAAKAANMSYRYAWSLIRFAEDHFGRQLINRQAGGHGGGGSELCKEGKVMLDVFEQLNSEVASFADSRFLKLYKQEKANV
jgi:molybdate transport system regulatory protein